MQSKSHTGITGKARQSLVRILDYVLKEECFLLATTHDYRWNVTGPNLYSLHRLFDEQRRQLDYWLDRVVERAKSIGLPKREFEKKARRTDTAKAGARLPARSMIGDLVARHERIAGHLRDDIARLPDRATAELLQRLLEFHETTAWMLRMVHNGPDSEPSVAKA
jgi:starvation-inducible DNA-binding protein